MSYIFVPPIIEEGSIGGNWLFSRYKRQEGVSVIKLDGEYYEIRYPTQDEVAAADIFYQGGHEYPVTNEEAADLQAAGYDVITS